MRSFRFGFFGMIDKELNSERRVYLSCLVLVFNLSFFFESCAYLGERISFFEFLMFYFRG